MPFRLLSLLFLALCISGCVRTVGDFERKEGSVFQDTILSETGHYAVRGRGELSSVYEMTDEEKELRNVAWDLVRPPGGGTWSSGMEFDLAWTRIAPQAWYKYDDANYYLLLRNGGLVSHETYYERLVMQARGDASRMPVFRDVAVRVGKADGARRAAMRALLADNVMRREAEARIADNARIVDWVEDSMCLRIRAYRTALGRLMIEMPSTKAVEVEAAIDALEWEIGGASKSCRRWSPEKSNKPAFRPGAEKRVTK